MVEMGSAHASGDIDRMRVSVALWIIVVTLMLRRLENSFTLVQTNKMMTTLSAIWLKVTSRRKCTKYETCAACTGFIFCTFPDILTIKWNRLKQIIFLKCGRLTIHLVHGLVNVYGFPLYNCTCMETQTFHIEDTTNFECCISIEETPAILQETWPVFWICSVSVCSHVHTSIKC